MLPVADFDVFHTVFCVRNKKMYIEESQWLGLCSGTLDEEIGQIYRRPADVLKL